MVAKGTRFEQTQCTLSIEKKCGVKWVCEMKQSKSVSSIKESSFLLVVSVLGTMLRWVLGVVGGGGGGDHGGASVWNK